MRAIAVTAIVVVLLAAGTPAQQAPPATGAISGVVTDAAGGRPITGVVVELRAPNTGASLARLTRQVTDGRGRFVFRGLAPGEGYSLQATRPGFANGSYGQTAMFGPSASLSLNEGEWFPSADITLWKPASISGRVVDEANEPVVGVFVRVMARALIGGAPTLLAGPAVKTDDRGDYRIAGLAGGEYLVFVPSPSSAVPDDAPTGVLGVAPPPLRMSPFAGMPTPARTDLLLDPVAGHRQVIGNHVTPPPGSDGRPRAYAQAFHPGVATVDLAPSVLLGSGEARAGVDVALRPVPVVHVFGRVVGPPEALNGVLLRLVPTGLQELMNGAEAATSLVGADGTFAFLHVPAGDYIIDAPSTVVEFTMQSADVAEPLPAPPGLRWGGLESRTLATGPPGAGYLRQSSPRVDAYWTRTPLSVGAEDLRDVVVTLHPPLSLHGRIEYEGTAKVTVDETPISGVAVVGNRTTVTMSTIPRPATQPHIVAEPAYAQSTLGLPRAERPPADGPQDRPLITGLRLGEYVIRVPSGADRYTVSKITIDGVDYSRTPFDTSRLTPTSEMVLTLTDALIEVRGTVSDEQGPATEGVVMVFPAERAEWRGYGLTPLRLKAVSLAGASTFALMGLPAGEYLVVAVPGTSVQAWQDPAFLEKAAAVATRLTLQWGEVRQLDLRQVRVR